MCPGQRKTDKEGPAFGYELLIVWREGPTEEQTVAHVVLGTIYGRHT